MKQLVLFALLFTALMVGIGTAILRTADFEPPVPHNTVRLNPAPHQPDGPAIRVADIEPAVRFNAGPAVVEDPEFEPPVRLMAGDAAIRVEGPGYAAPCWADLNGDGRQHLLVGQFRKGKIQVFEHLNAEHFSPGHWLQAAGNVAEVPGIW